MFWNMIIVDSSKHYILLMEGTETIAPSNFKQELLNLQQLQEQIERTKKELSQLGKIELN